MPTQDQVIPINFSKGINTKADPKVVPMGQVLRLQDCVSTQADQADKRPGTGQISNTIIGGGTITAPRMMGELNGELICADIGNFYSYSGILQAWQNKGYYISVGVGLMEIASASRAQFLQNAVLWNNYAIYNWVQISGNFYNGFTAIQDLTTDSLVVPTVGAYPTPQEGVVGVAKSFVCGGGLGTVPGTVTPDDQGNLALTTFNITSGGISLGGPNILYSAASIPVSYNQYNTPFAAAVLAAAAAADTSAAAIASAAATAASNAAATAASALSTYNSALATYNSNPTTPNYLALQLAFAALQQANYAAASAATTSAQASANATAAHNAYLAAQQAQGGGRVFIFDAAGTSGGGVVAFGTGLPGNAGTLQVKTFDQGGTVTHSFSLNQTQPITAVRVFVGANGNIWVYYVDYQLNFKYVILSSVLATVLASHTIAATSGNPIFNITAIINSNTQQQFFYSLGNGVTPDSTDIYGGTVSSTGTVTNLTTVPLARNLDLYSDPFKYNNKTYLGAIYRSSGGTVNVNVLQNTIFIINVDGFSPGAVVAKALPGAAFASTNPPGSLSSVLALSSSEFGLFVPQVVTTDITLGFESQVSQSTVATFDFNHPDAYQNLITGNTMVMNGGLLWEYDGSSITELGFLLYPEVVNASFATTGGNLDKGLYSWAFVLQWTDAQGNFHQSTPYFYQIDTTGSGTTTNIASFTIRVPGTTLKQINSPPRLAVYRTQKNGSTYTLVDASTIVSRQFASIFFADGNSDSSIASDDDLYTNGGVLDNDAPPAALAMALHNNRLWVIDSTNPNNIAYSKTQQPGVGLSFSNNLTAQIDSIGGKCIALAHMDSNLVIFEEKMPLILAGDGANDVGQNSTLGTPQPIPSDTGCNQSKGVITFPGGVIFKSPKGIYMLDRAYKTDYIGMAVEAYNAQNISSSILIDDKSQIRFLTSTTSGLTLVYDYIFNRWSTFTYPPGYSATLWQDLYVYCRTDGVMVQETPGSYLDVGVAYGALIQSSWLATAGVQGLERIKQMLLLGNYKNGASNLHGIQSSFAYDFIESYTTTLPYYFDTAASITPYEYRTFLPKQKAASVSILIQEQVTGDANEFVTFTNLSFLAGMKKGLNKMPAAKSVG